MLRALESCVAEGLGEGRESGGMRGVRKTKSKEQCLNQQQ